MEIATQGQEMGGGGWAVRRGYGPAGWPMLLIADPVAPGGDEAEAAIALAGGRLLQRVAWANVATTLPHLASWPILVIETAGVATATLDAALPGIATYIERSAVSAVVTMDEAQIDAVAGHLLHTHATLLCAPTAGQRAAALIAAASRQTPVLHDKVQEEDDTERLHRLNQEVAHIASLLAGLAHPRPMASMAADRRPRYDSGPAVPGRSVGPQQVRRMIHLRRLRSKFFGQFMGEGLFEDPAWDMLLDLFAAELEGTRVSVSSLCIAAGVAPTTALRWIAKMTEMELFIRHPDPLDRRRAFMALSPRASEAMRGYMIAAAKAEAGG